MRSSDHWQAEALSREPSNPRDPMSYMRVVKDRNRLEAEVGRLRTELRRVGMERDEAGER